MNQTIKKLNYWMRDTTPAIIQKWEHQFLVESAYDLSQHVMTLREELNNLRKEMEELRALLK